MRLSSKLDRIPPYLFAEIDRKIELKRSEGIDVISFGVGDPDFPTPPVIVDALCRYARLPEQQGYPSYYGLSEYREAAARWMRRRFGVDVDPESQVLSLIGSKEGIAHLAFAALDHGDMALIPEPSYPVYQMGTLLAGGEARFLPLRAENGFLPDLEAAEEEARDARVLWINYPSNPTGAVADRSFFEKAVDFARQNELVLAHDNAYSEITYDGFVAPSLLEVDGSMEVGIEFHSLSKTFNMTGWRVGFACGSASVIEGLGTVKTNIDSGIFNPIQLASVVALDNSEELSGQMRELYQKRRDTLVNGLGRLGWKVEPPLGAIYIWMPVPEGFDSVGFSSHVLQEAGVFFTPGNAYGPSGEGYVRISLTVPDDRIETAMARLRDVFGG